MTRKYKEYKGLDLPSVNKEILKQWESEKAFEQSLETRKDGPEYIFFEGPPSANGMPGIHHVMARAIKDVFCRYKTMQGFRVDRKAGWDTHGLPVELGVEKSLGITKEDIGKTISIEEYNNHCRVDVMRFTDAWEELTDKMGYWVDMDNPYITYDNRYIETLWYLLKEIFNKGLLYKGKTIQPFSPAAGTGLSTHELNQPGCYRDVKDTTVVAQFSVIKDKKSSILFDKTDTEVYILAWTTTPWTLPSNTALAVGANINYVFVKSFNPYTGEPISVILSEDKLDTYFSPANAEIPMNEYNTGDKKIPFKVLAKFTGKELEGISYNQLIPWIKPEGNAFKVIVGDFVTTEEGTGIVHIAPTFGADDDRVAKQYGISPLILRDKALAPEPMVDRKGRFYRIEDLDDDFVKKYVDINTYRDFAGRYVKNEYDPAWDGKSEENTDVDISVMLKKENKAFRIEKYVHNYPHCWRTDKPILYYPLDSWFIKTTAVKDRMIELNKTINWKPQSTGEGRFGKWLENLVDWNLSRSRYWGTPLPIWMSADRKEIKCIGSVEELYSEIEKAVTKGVMKKNPLKGFTVGDYSKENYEKIDLHRPFVDDILLVSETGQPMQRELDLIDVWFDSGAMPYAQWHYPFENRENFDKLFPADFIAEGVDQTRGWFFTLHAIATIISDSVSFKNIVSNGLVLDKNGNKMSKRLGNAVDPFIVIDQYGADPLRWYMITNSQPWDNLKFDIEGVAEVSRKFFGTLYNTYSFFALYANVDGFANKEEQIPVANRPEIDRWVLSGLNSLIKEVTELYDTYEPTRAGRLIANFVDEDLSNWYVRLNRKRFWGGEYNADKIAAYQTLYTCLKVIAQLSAPIAPFFSDRLFRDLTNAGKESQSVHLSYFPKADNSVINTDLERKMKLAQRISSMILGLRRKVNIRVRQPLQKILIPVLDERMKNDIAEVENIILSEVNIKEIEYILSSDDILVKKVKPNFKTLGPRFGKQMKDVAATITAMTQKQINQIEAENKIVLQGASGEFEIGIDDVEIVSEDIPGLAVSSEGQLTVALDIQISEELRYEGIARELINRIQNMRKDSGLDVTDKIKLYIRRHKLIDTAVNNHSEYISTQVLAAEIVLFDDQEVEDAKDVELEEDLTTQILIEKVN
ncbi:MAG: isoleucine--tRNA ligase [Salinivirgaceae bacterium]|jgi:isoleucyl-tRNA synthetase|nr:isoleucine--tRNA ligase [Bacteroidales bacterium]